MEDAPVDLSMPHIKPIEEKMTEMSPMDLSTTLQQSNKNVESQPPSFEHDPTQLSEPSTSSANSGTAEESILTEKTTFSKSSGESTDD